MSFFDDLLNFFSGDALDANAATSAFAPNQQQGQQANNGSAPTGSSSGNLSGFLWKPVGERDGRLTVLLPPGVSASQVQLADQQGNIIDSGRLSVSPQHPDGRTNGGRLTYRFSNPGGAYGNNVKVLVDGQELTSVANGAARFEGSGGGLAATTGSPFGFSSVTDAFGNTSLIPSFSNPFSGIGFDPLQAPNIPTPENPFVDPLTVAGNAANFNEAQFAEIIKNTLAQSPDIANQLNQANFDVADQTFNFQADQVGRANQTNQEQLTNRVESQLPGFIAGTRDDLATARTLAGGGLPDFIDERVLLGGVRNSATDDASFQGFGAGSVFGRNVADRLDARTRLGLVESGQNLTDQIANRAFKTFVDSPIKVTPVVPNPVTADSIFSSFSNTRLGNSTVSPANAIQSTVQQNQFGANLVDNANRFNATGQFQADQFNTNQALALAVGSANAGLGLQQMMFNAGQDFANNTANSQFANDQLQALIGARQDQNNQNTAMSALNLGMKVIGQLGSGDGFLGSLGNGTSDNMFERIVFGADGATGLGSGFLGTGLFNGTTDTAFERGLDAVGDYILDWF